MQQLGRRVLLQFKQQLGKASMQADDVAALDFNLVGIEDLHQIIVANRDAFPAERRVQVDHYAASLCAVLGQVLDAERFGAAALEARPLLGVWLFFCWNDLNARPKPIVENRLSLAVAVGVEQAADM